MSIGLREGFRPGTIGAVWCGVIVAVRLSMVIVAEFCEPVTRLRPAVFPDRAGVALADLDLHVRPPVEPGVSAMPLGNPAKVQGHSGLSDWAALRVPGGPGSDRADAADCGLAGCCDRSAPNMSGCRQRAPDASRGRSPPSRLTSPFKAPGLTVSLVSVFTFPTINHNSINLR